MHRFKRFCPIALVILTTLAANASQSHFLKDITVAVGDTLSGDLSIYRGNLDVSGVVNGNVVVMIGNCRLLPEGRILGNLAVVQGKLELADPSQVTGRISQRDFLRKAAGSSTSPFDMEAVPMERDQTDEEEDAKATRSFEDDDSGLFLSFNRVAGLQLGLELQKGSNPIRMQRFADLTGYAAWAFGAKRPEWNLKLRKRLVEKSSIYLAVGLHRLTDTQDGWLISSSENSIAGWLLQMDFRDYFDNRGIDAELGGFFLDGLLHLNAGLFREKYGPMELNTQWSWSRADRQYRPNLFSESTGYVENHNQGIRTGLDLRLTKDVRSDDDLAWQRFAGMTLSWEKSLEHGDYTWDYDRVLANLRFATPIGKRRMEHISARLLAAYLNGSAPAQYHFRLGGPDALPGFRPKAIDGFGSDNSRDSFVLDPTLGKSSMTLLSLENRFNGQSLDFWPFSSLDLLLMADVGQVVDGAFGNLTRDGFRADMGFGIANQDDDFKLALFRATDSGEADWRLLCRIQRRF